MTNRKLAIFVSVGAALLAASTVVAQLGENIAPNAQATASSEYNSIYVAEKANDGNTST